MTEDRTLYGNPTCACSFRSQGHEPGECGNFAASGVWMWEPVGWGYVWLCGSCNRRCGQLSTEEYAAVSEGRALPRENGWDINEPATQLSRSRSGIRMTVAVIEERFSTNIERVRCVLGSLEPRPTPLIHGAARGGDHTTPRAMVPLAILGETRARKAGTLTRLPVRGIVRLLA